MTMEPKNSPAYHVLDSNSDSGESDAFLVGSRSPADDEFQTRLERKSGRSLLRDSISGLSWALNFILAALSLILLSKLQSTSSDLGSYKSGFVPDFSFANEVPLELVRFTGSPHFHENGTAWRDAVDPDAHWPENMQLFGDPSPEVDENWKQYIGKRYFSISEEEATRAWGDKRHEYVDQKRGGYSAGLDVFHSLHCINALRLALHPEYYNSDSHHLNHLPHTEHCLDVLRQSIQCYGSTTLIPTKFFEGRQRNYIDSDQVHVCRNFNYLRDFVTSRAKGHEAYVERDRSLLDERKHAIVKQYYADKKAKHKGNSSNAPP